MGAGTGARNSEGIEDRLRNGNFGVDPVMLTVQDLQFVPRSKWMLTSMERKDEDHSGASLWTIRVH